MIQLALWVASAIFLVVCGLCVVGALVAGLIWVWEQAVSPTTAAPLEGEGTGVSSEDHRRKWERFRSGGSYDESGSGKIYDAEIVD